MLPSLFGFIGMPVLHAPPTHNANTWCINLATHEITGQQYNDVHNEQFEQTGTPARAAELHWLTNEAQSIKNKKEREHTLTGNLYFDLPTAHGRRGVSRRHREYICSS